MVKWNPFLSGACTFLGGMLLWSAAARADVSTTNAAAIVVFPKILVNVSEETRIDTVIQLTNTAANPVNVRCFYVNANGFCSNDEKKICDPEDAQGQDHITTVCGPFATCVPSWQETDFRFRLTSKQPIVWTAFEGLLDLPLDLGIGEQTGEVNSGSIPPSPANPFRGELKCIEVGDDEAPIDHNDLKGEASIETLDTTPTVDIRTYNAIGIQAIEGANNGDDTLVLGDPNGNPPGEYNACPNILVLDHFFDDAREPSDVRDVVRTHLTLVPCSEDFNLQAPLPTTVQFLVFNEFEQRFSTSRPVTCFSERTLSDIDTKLGATGDAQSIFNVNVEGTLTGQTLIRGVANPNLPYGNGLLAIAEEFHCSTAGVDMSSDMSDGKKQLTFADCGSGATVTRQFSAAFATVERGTRTQPDFVVLPAAAPAGP